MKRLFSIGMVALLAGCGDANLSQLESVMEEIRRA
ncbi:MAG TPA: pilus assembly protein PilP, partial [Halomonas sp.]|nr:pilus assembly protein PilP [Halomonas sp.]